MNMFRKLVLTGLVLWSLCVQAQPDTAAAEPVFDVYEYLVEGNTLLPAQAVQDALMPFMGPERKFSDLEQARAGLEKAYQDAGYLSVVVSLPNQRVDKGEVRLEVTEAPLRKLTVSGAQYNLPSKIENSLPSLRLGEVPHFPQMQDEIVALQSGNRQVTPLINASDDGKGIEVELKVEDKLPVSASVEFNNSQSYNTSRGRMAATVTASNLFQRDHTFGVSWQYAPFRPSDSNTLSLIYALPLSGQDDLLLSLTNSDSDTPTGSTGTDAATTVASTISKGTFFGLRWTHRLDSMGWPVRHSFHAAVDYKHNRDASTFKDGDIVQRPPTRYPVLSLGYNLTHNSGDDQVYTLSTAIKGSSRGLAGRQVDCEGVARDQFDCKRAGASADFMAWQVGVGHGRPLLGNWRLNLSADAQIASGPLPSGEQYSLGGSATVRGYYDYEQSGDEGWSTRAELVTPVWFDKWGFKATALGFADRGMVRIINPQLTQDERTHLGSFGLGLRVSNGDAGFELGLDVAKAVFDTQRPVDNGQREYASGPAADRPYRVDFSVRQSF